MIIPYYIDTSHITAQSLMTKNLSSGSDLRQFLKEMLKAPN